MSIKGAVNGVLSSSLDASQHELFNSPGELAFAWNKDAKAGSSDYWVSETRSPFDYDYVVTVSVTSGLIATQDKPNGGFTCGDSANFKPVDVSCIKGDCQMPSSMFIGSNNGRVCYNKAYGLVQSDGSNQQCDWTVDGQGFKSIYFETLQNAGGGCGKMKDTSGSSFVAPQSGMFHSNV